MSRSRFVAFVSFPAVALLFSLSITPTGAQSIAHVRLDAESVDGFDAAVSPTPGMLLPLDGQGRFPFTTIQACAVGQILKYTVTGWTCGADQGGTSYTAGSGLTLAGTQFSASYGGVGGDAGSAASLARADHLHDARYPLASALGTAGTINTASNPVDWTKLKGVPGGFADGVDAVDGGNASDLTCAGCVAESELGFPVATQAEVDALGTAGTINTASNPVHWTKLKGVPAGIADGLDADTTYAAGAGLVLSGTTFSANLVAAGGDAGSAGTVARGDHIHDGRYATESELGTAGVINTATNPVDWTRLKNVPSGLADGADDDHRPTHVTASNLNVINMPDTACRNIASIAITAPTSGRVHVSGIVDLAINHTAGQIDEAYVKVWTTTPTAPRRHLAAGTCSSMA